MTAPLDLPGTTPAVLVLRADKPWLRTPGSGFAYELTTLESSPRLQPMLVDGRPSGFGLAATAVYR